MQRTAAEMFDYQESPKDAREAVESCVMGCLWSQISSIELLNWIRRLQLLISSDKPGTAAATVHAHCTEIYFVFSATGAASLCLSGQHIAK